MKQLQHWQDSGNAVIGLWLMFSPLVLGFQGDVTALANALLVGLVLLATALGAIFVPRAWEEWTETGLGLWLAVSPWVLALQTPVARGTAVVTGLVILTLSLWALQDYESAGRQAPGPETTAQ